MDRGGENLGREGRMRSAANPLGLKRLAGAALLVLAFGVAPAAALDFPTRPITLIVPHVPGGPSDVIARVLGRLLLPVLRQPIVVENRPGSGGNIAAEQAAHAKADGHTLLLGNTAILAANPARGKSTRFDPQLDFAPITLIGTQANVLVVNPSLPVDTLQQLIQLAKARPGFVTFASAGHGSASHLAAALFEAESKTSLIHVPYKKPGPALQDVVGGHVQIMFAPAALVRNHIRAGRLRALALATKEPSPLLPGIATIGELGIPGFNATTWYGLAAPAGTPRRIVDELYHSTAAALENPEARKIMGDLGIDVVGNSPREFDAFVAAEIPRWAAAVKAIAQVD